MKHLIVLLAVIILSTTVSASCQIYHDYCINITLPQYNVTALPLPPGVSAVPFLFKVSLDDIVGELNMEGQAYVNTSNYSNVYSYVDNTTDTVNGGLWNGPYIESDTIFPTYLRYDRVTGNHSGFANSSHAIICLNGSNIDYGYPHKFPVTNTVISQVNLTLSDFTQYYRRNWTFRDEPNNTLHNFTGENATLEVWCNDYSEFNLNLTDLVGDGGDLTIQTIQRPKYSLSIDGLPPRVRQDVNNFLKDDYFVLDSTEGIEYTFNLADYTAGEFYKSTLSVQRTLNDSLENIHVEQFDQSNTIDVYLMNRTQYRIFVTNEAGAVRDLGSLYLTESEEKDIVVTRPSVGEYQYNYQDSNITITWDYSNSLLACQVIRPTGTTAFWNIENISANGSITQDTFDDNIGTDVSFSKTVVDRNLTYRIRCGYNDTIRGLVYRTQTIRMRNESAIYGGFDMNLPTSFIGLQRTTIYNFAILIVLVVLVGLFGEISHGIGAITAGTVILFGKFIGYLETSWMLAFTAFYLGIFISLRRGRKPIG